jgi:hypothetical protein
MTGFQNDRRRGLSVVPRIKGPSQARSANEARIVLRSHEAQIARASLAFEVRG